MKLITFGEARERFIRDRLIGDVPRAFKGGRCVYDKRINGGCAIGCMIPDDIEYNKKWEGSDVIELFRNYEEVGSRFAYPAAWAWHVLQDAHDMMNRHEVSGAPGCGNSSFSDAVKRLLEQPEPGPPPEFS